MIPEDPATESQAERHFIELATRPLEDHPAVRDEARGELMERLSRQDPSQREAMAEAALARLAKIVPASWRGKAIGLTVAWLIMTGIAVGLGYGLYREVTSGDELHDFRVSLNAASPEGAPARELVELEESLEWNRRIPDNFHATWTKLDPDNGAWPWREAIDQFEEWNNKPHHTDAEFEEVWKLVDAAAKAPRFEFYLPEERVRKVQILGNPETCYELGNRLNVFYFWSYNRQEEFITGLFENKARLLVAAKDAEGLRATIRIWEKLCLQIAQECLHRQDIKHPTNLTEAGERLRDAAKTLGLTAEEQRLDRLSTAISQRSLLNSTITHLPEMGTMASQLYLQGPPPPAEAYRPGRMMEYAAVERLCALIAASILLLVLAVLILESVRRGRRVNGLATGSSPLFDGKDGLWLIGLGLLAPFAWYWLVTRLTPFGFRDVGMFEFDYPANLVQMTAAFLLGLALIIQTAQWRVGVRAQVIGLQPGLPWLGWLMVGMTALLVPAAGIGRWIPPHRITDFFMITGASCGLPLLWILWRGCALIFGPNSNALPGVLASRAATLPLLLATALLLAAHPLLLAIEKNWMAQDTISGWDTKRGTTYQEARSVDAVVARCRELFGEAGATPPQE